MEYNVSNIKTLEECETILAGVQQMAQTLAAQRVQLEVSIAPFEEKVTSIAEEAQLNGQTLAAYYGAYEGMPDGNKSKEDMKIQIERAETRGALLVRLKRTYNTQALLDKQYDFNLLENNVPEAQAYVAALEARKAELEAGS